MMEEMESEDVDGGDEKFVFHSHAKRSLEKMKDLFVSQKLTDVTLVASDVEITAHRLVLSSASDYFKAMFTGDLLEANMSRVQLVDTDPDALQSLVDFCYSGEIVISGYTVETLLATANVLQITEVVNACSKFLSDRLMPSNCLGISLFSESHGCMDLHQIAHKYVMDNFIHVIKYSEYLSLPAEVVKELFSSDMLNVPSEEKAFLCLMEWVEKDQKNRLKDLPDLLEAIKLPLLSPQFLADIVGRYSVIKEDLDCSNLIIEAMEYQLLAEQRAYLFSPRTRPRKSTVGDVFIIGGMDGIKGTCDIEQYHLRDNSWTRYGAIASRRLQFGAAVIEDKLYVVGGRDGLKTLNIVECCSLRNGKWSGMPSMSTHRHGLGVGVIRDLMYAVGGHDGWTYLNAVERWDSSSHQWSYVASLNTQRSTAGVAVVDDRLYAVGGRDGSSCLSSVECFDPYRNKWTFCAPMSVRRGGAGVGVIDGFLFVVGGHDAPILNPGVSRFDCVERYDPRSDQWSLVAPMSVGRDSVGVGVLGDRLVAVGGYDGQTYSKIVEAYDPQTNEWEQLKELEEGRAGMCVVVVKMFDGIVMGNKFINLVF